MQACFHGGIKYATLVSSTLQTLAASRYIHKTRSPMSNLISYLYNIMSGVKYNEMRCQSARQGCKKMVTNGTDPSEQSNRSMTDSLCIIFT